MELEINNNVLINRNKINIITILKKSIVFLLAFIIVLILISNISFHKVSSVQAESFRVNNLITNDSMNINNIKSIQEAINKANSLPDSVKYKLYNEGYTIKLQKDLIHLKGNKTDVAQGINDFSNKRITVVHFVLDKNFKTDDVLLNDNDSITLLHEISHTIDENVKYSSSAGFVKIFEQENRELFNTNIFHNVSNSYMNYYAMYSDEYFAETCALYFNSKESRNILKAHAPLTYQFIKENIDK
jgi:hypothetical protein